jgi:hypothetical protein
VVILGSLFAELNSSDAQTAEKALSPASFLSQLQMTIDLRDNLPSGDAFANACASKSDYQWDSQCPTMPDTVPQSAIPAHMARDPWLCFSRDS